MRSKDILAILGVAAATMAFTVTLLGPGRVGATNPPEGIKPTIARPELTLDGCTFTLTTDKSEYGAGEMPVVRIEATNPTDQPVETAVWVNMTSRSPESMFSRVMVIPTPLWTGKQLVTLAPGETKTFSLPTETALPEGSMISFALGDQNVEILGRTLSVNLGSQASQRPNTSETTSGE